MGKANRNIILSLVILAVSFISVLGTIEVIRLEIRQAAQNGAEFTICGNRYSVKYIGEVKP